jgi:putative ABC transport system permease protein
MNGFLQDLRLGVRTLRKNPGFTAVAAATLALGIGANAAVFSVLDAVILRPLPYAAGDRLVMLGDLTAEDATPNNVGYATYEDLRDRNRTFDAIAAVRFWQPTLVTEGVAERIPGMRVTANYFPMLGARPALGRGFLPEEDRPDSRRVVLLSDGLWRSRFGADPSVVGRVIPMDGQSYRIVGVMPPDFQPLVSARYYKRAQMWAPVGYDRSLKQACRGCQHLKAVGRLAAGISFEQARGDLDRIRGELVREHPDDYGVGRMDVVPLSRELTSGLRTPLFILIVAVGFVLLIACANVANLILTRSLQRTHELAIRGALGASRGRLVRQLLSESIVLCVLGGAAGVGLASGLQSALLRLAPVSLARLDQVAMDLRVVGFAALTSFAAVLLSGIFPALRASAVPLAPSLAAGARGSAGVRSAFARRALTAVELTLAVVLVSGAFLMVRSMRKLLDAPVGFSADRVMTVALSVDGDDAGVLAFQERLLERVQALPGVEAAAIVSQIPLGGNGDSYGFHVFGHLAANPSDDPSVERYAVTPGYFEAMGVPLRRGRLFTPADRTDSLPVMLVSETTARTLFPGRDPIGERVRIGGHETGPWRTIVGVVGDVRHVDVAVRATPQMYLPQSQMTDAFVTLVARTTNDDPTTLTEPIRRVVRELDPRVPIDDAASLSALVDRSAASRRFVMRLLGGFAASALLLAAIGLYGVIAQSVAQRTREIGIRMALGASPRNVMLLVLGGGGAMVGFGLAAGIAGSLLAGRFLSGILYEIGPTDPVSLTGAAVLLAAVALAAHWLPARRAARVDPIAALRSE